MNKQKIPVKKYIAFKIAARAIKKLPEERLNAVDDELTDSIRTMKDIIQKWENRLTDHLDEYIVSEEERNTISRVKQEIDKLIIESKGWSIDRDEDTMAMIEKARNLQNRIITLHNIYVQIGKDLVDYIGNTMDGFNQFKRNVIRDLE